MNKSIAEGNWKVFKGKVRERWGKLTDDELDQLKGKQDQIAGRIQERYGTARDEIERELEKLRKSL